MLTCTRSTNDMTQRSIKKTARNGNDDTSCPGARYDGSGSDANGDFGDSRSNA